MVRANSAKEDMPSPREYRALKRTASDKVDEEFRLECRFVLRTIGELGLRAGEVSHITEEWVDFDTNEIRIPSFDKCTKANDGGPCGYCKKRAKQNAKAMDISYERALRKRWEPKNEASERDVWFGWNPELVELIDEYLYKNGRYTSSRVSINRRVDMIAESCEMVTKNDIYPHALRAHAAKFHATEGMRAFQLKELMGWSEVSGAMDYIKMASNDVKSELKRVHQNPYGR